MTIIVDTSVWSCALRRRKPADDPQSEKLAIALKQAQPIALLGVILQEILQGIRDPKDFDKVKAHLVVLPLIALEREDFIAAAKLRNTCAAQGILASTMDFQIATACLRHDCALLTNDKDFQHIAQCCPLQLL